MGDVGLLLVGAVLFVNGVSSLGLVPARSAAPLNLFVGAAQVVLPTIILVQAHGDAAVIAATWPSYLFGFTYLWFGIIQLTGLDAAGFGWYSAFVAAIALYEAAIAWAADPVFAVIWLTWAIMWSLFFVLLGLGITRAGPVDLGRATGWFLVLLGIPTCTVPAIALIGGHWTAAPGAGVAALAALVGAAALSTALARTRPAESAADPAAAPHAAVAAPVGAAPVGAAPVAAASVGAAPFAAAE